MAGVFYGAKEKMLRMIENQAVNLNYLAIPRTTLLSSAEELIKTIKDGRMPDEEAINDFFSFYDKPLKHSHV